MIIKLGEVASYINGYAFKPSDWSDNGMPIIRIQDLTGNSYKMNRYNGDIEQKYKVQDGDVLISWSASLGVYVWHGENAVLNQHIFKVVFDKTDVSKDYFVYQIEYRLKNAASEAHGATMKHLTKAVFNALPFYLPKKEEQEKIEKVLNKITELTNKTRKQAKLLDDIIKSRFIEMFDGEYPEETLFNLCNIIDYRGKTPEKVESGLPFITAKNVKMHHMALEPREYISKETYDKVMVRGFPKEGDVVFTTEAPLGNVCRIPHFDTEFYIGQRIVTIQTEELNPIYLEYALSAEEFVRKYMRKSSGSTVKGIRVRLLEQLTIPVPLRVLQDDFANFVLQTGKSKHFCEMEVA